MSNGRKFLIVACATGLLWWSLYARSHRVVPAPVPPVDVPVPKPPDIPTPPPVVEPEFVLLSAFTNQTERSIFGDVMAHAPNGPVGGGRSTNAHETSHDIHAYLRNQNKSRFDRPINAVYCLDSRGVIIEEPRILKSQVCAFVPARLQNFRYQTYVSGAKVWDRQPLYIVDEWVAYTLGAMVNVEDVQEGRYREVRRGGVADMSWSCRLAGQAGYGDGTDGVSGCLHLAIFSTALCMAIKEHDPEYWKTNRQFRRFVGWWMKEAHRTYMAGNAMPQFNYEMFDNLRKDLRTHADAEPMRAFLRENFGGIWLE